MKYCPQCKGEFQDWVEKCPDCQAKLVDESLPQLEKGNPATKEPLVIIAKYSTLVDANLIKEILESEGIKPVATEEVEPSNRWFSASESGGAYVLVSEKNVGEAVEIIRSITDVVPISYADIYEPDDEEDYDQ